MARPTALISLLALCLWAWGQGFAMEGTAPATMRGTARLTLYARAGARTIAAPMRKGAFRLEGSVEEATAARLDVGHGTPLYLWVENAAMTVEYDPQRPAASRVVGSRANSEYRYALEQCGTQPEDLLHYAAQHLDQPFVPFLLWLHYHGDDAQRLEALCDRLAGPATQAYHLPLLRQRAEAMRHSAEGQPIPSFEAPLPNGDLIPYDSLHRADRSTYLLFATTWMEQEQRLLDSLRQRIDTTQAQALWVAVDKHPSAWDAPCMQQLDIPYLPYLILVSPNGIIERRDVRVWELNDRNNAPRHITTPKKRTQP